MYIARCGRKKLREPTRDCICKRANSNSRDYFIMFIVQLLAKLLLTEPNS